MSQPLAQSSLPMNTAIQRAKRRQPDRAINRAPQDTWIPAYLTALACGHQKKSAAALAGVSSRTPYARAKSDPDFAEREEVAYNCGTAILEQRAMDRIFDNFNPSDGVLRHILACRGLNPKQIVEMTGADGGPIEINTSVDLSKLPLWLQKEMIRCMEAIERGEEPPDRPMLEEYEKVIEVNNQSDDLLLSDRVGSDGEREE